MNTDERTSRAQARQNLLDELESIRTLLREPDEHKTEPTITPSPTPVTVEIPVLTNQIPVLDEAVPVLVETVPLLKPEPPVLAEHQATVAPIQPTPAPANTLDTVRSAAALVAARAVRNRPLPITTAPTAGAHRDQGMTENRPDAAMPVSGGSSEKREALVEEILSALRPELENLIRKILRDKLND